MSKVKNTFFGGDEKRAARKQAEGQRAAGQEIRKAEELGVEAQREQLAITEGRISPFTQAGTDALSQQRILLGLGASPTIDPNAARRIEIESEIAQLQSSAGQAAPVSQFSGGSSKSGIAGLVSRVQAQAEEQARIQGATQDTGRLESLQAELQGFGEVPQGTTLSAQEQQEQAFAQLQESPGQQFLRRRQEKALLRNAAATGGLGGSNVLTALQQQAVGFGQQDIENQFGRLSTLSGRGQQAATDLGQFGGTSATNIQAGLSRAGGGVAQGVAGSAATKAQGILGQGAALRGGIQQLAGGVAGGLSGGLAAGVAGPPISGGQRFGNAVQGFFGV